MIISKSVIAQNLIIKGEIVDLVTDEKIAGAIIQQKGSNATTISAGDGNFTIRIKDLKNAELVIKALNYKEKIIPVTSSSQFIRAGMESVSSILQEVVVTGTQKEVRRMESPVPVETYSAKFLQKNVTSCFFESLSIINGVQPQINCNVCNTGDIHINGMDGAYTMILIDGMPIVSQLSSVYGLSGIPTSLIKRLEIVKGPSSTLYGSEAMGGVINIITNDIHSVPKISVDVNTTSKLETNADVSYSTKAGAKATTLLGINYFNYNQRADINHDGFTDVTLQDRYSIFNKWAFKRKTDLPFNLAVRYLHENRWGGEVNWSSKWRGTDSIYGESIYTKRFELIGNYGLKINKEKLLFEYSYNYHNQDAAYGITLYKATQHTAFAQIRWDKKIGKHDLLAGIPFRYFWLDDNTPATLSADGKTNQPFIDKQPGVFVQDEFKWNKHISILAGLRYEHNEHSGNIFSPRLAFKIQPDQQNTIRLSGGNGFRNVNIFTEDHASLIGIRQLVIKENLKPEKCWNATLNYNGQYPFTYGFFGIDVSGWYTYFTNKIIPDLSDVTKIIYDNTKGYAVSKGVSANFDLTLKSGFKFLVGVTLMDVYQMKDDSLGSQTKVPQEFAPNFSATYVISYNAKRGGWSVDLTGKVFGPEHLPVINADPANGIIQDFRPEMSPWFTLMNIQVTKKISRFSEIYISGKNLLNFIPQYPIMRPKDPFDKHLGVDVGPEPYNKAGYVFDPSYNYAPMQGIKLMVGYRLKIY